MPTKAQKKRIAAVKRAINMPLLEATCDEYNTSSDGRDEAYGELFINASFDEHPEWEQEPSLFYDLYPAMLYTPWCLIRALHTDLKAVFPLLTRTEQENRVQAIMSGCNFAAVVQNTQALLRIFGGVALTKVIDVGILEHEYHSEQ